MNWLDRAISSISPERAVRRLQARRALAAYEAAKPTVLRKQSKDSGSGNAWIRAAGNNLRNQARFLDANHDLSRGVLNALVNNTDALKELRDEIKIDRARWESIVNAGGR